MVSTQSATNTRTAETRRSAARSRSHHQRGLCTTSRTSPHQPAYRGAWHQSDDEILHKTVLTDHSTESRTPSTRLTPSRCQARLTSSGALHLLPQPGLSPLRSGLAPSVGPPHSGRSPQPSRPAACAPLLEARTSTDHLLQLVTNAGPNTPGPPECGPSPPGRQLSVSMPTHGAQCRRYGRPGSDAGAAVRPDRRQPRCRKRESPQADPPCPQPQKAAGSALQQGAPVQETRTPSQALPRGRACPPDGKTLRPALGCGLSEDQYGADGPGGPRTNSAVAEGSPIRIINWRNGPGPAEPHTVSAILPTGQATPPLLSRRFC
ncbi:hypothetical protein NDU88_000199 [Pleurodeles waltl]|uniref:Uncharacterized protein n=1 Tax=Pleurodeles waltl TaxID=8319 RepID=A0AAV7VWP6_PLEWA|nr:hypothetical protein NDU88_000199 [Pleurodeles waltl]